MVFKKCIANMNLSLFADDINTYNMNMYVTFEKSKRK